MSLLPEKPINVNAMTQKIDVDNRIPIRNYYRIADNLLKQASIYREEKNIIDLYIILLRYVSLVTETIPMHRDYQILFTKDRAFNKKKAYAVMDEVESLKPQFQRAVNELNKAHDRYGQYRVGAPARKSYPSVSSVRCQSSHLNKQLQSGQIIPCLHNQNACQTQVLQPSALDNQFQKLSISMPLPKQETLSRHSFLGPNGFRGQWLAPRPEIKVQYPNYSDFTSSDNLGLIQPSEYEIAVAKGNITKLDLSPMESVLSLDDGGWHKASSVNIEANNDRLPLGIIRQPSPPPVLAQVQPEYHPISPSRVADPRPGPAKPLQDGIASSNSYQNLHIPVKLMDDFLRLARQNTEKNLETCGVLAGSLKNRVFHITTLIIPKQESTSDSCETLNEEDIFDVQDKLSLFPLGWIHTHPTQTCFMSSVDLHTHYSYQIMLPEAIAIVMAPTDTESPHGIFHLSDPGGVSVIRNCQQRGFHPHEEPDDGSPIYEHCSHVFINENMRFDVIDLRRD